MTDKLKEVLRDVARQYARRLVDVHLGNIEALAQLRYRFDLSRERYDSRDLCEIRQFIESIHIDGSLARTFSSQGIIAHEKGELVVMEMLSDPCEPETIPKHETRDVPVELVADRLDEIKASLRDAAARPESCLTGSRVVVPAMLGGFCVGPEELLRGKGSPRMVSIAFEVPSLELESVTEQVHVRDEVIPLPTEVVEMGAP